MSVAATAATSERCIWRSCFGGHGELREAIGDTLELQERWQHDVHVGFSAARFVEAFDGGSWQDADGNFLSDDRISGLVGREIYGMARIVVDIIGSIPKAKVVMVRQGCCFLRRERRRG